MDDLSFEDSDFYLDITKVTLGPIIGSGNFSKVYIGEYFGDLVAVKQQTRTEADLEAYLLRELAILKNLSSPHLVEYMGACNVVSAEEGKPSSVYIVTELLRGGDLSALITAEAEIGWKLRARIACDIAQGLQALHEKPVVHRDVKSGNILLDDAFRAKLCDFGFARQAINSRMTICGTDDYMAPELLFDEEYGAPADIFSFGMVLAELITRKLVGQEGFAQRRPHERFQLDIDALRAECPADAPPSLVELMCQCVSYEAEMRPETEVVVDWLEALIEDQPEDDVPLPPLPPMPEFDPSTASAVGGSASAEAEAAAEEAAAGGATADGGSGGGQGEAGQSEDADLRSRAEERQHRIALSVGTLTKTGALGQQVVFKTGWLFKRNRSGFRNWKRRWFVLCGTQLSWYQSEAASECHGTLDLSGCTVVGGKQNRFQLLRTGGIHGPADDRLFNRELGAEDATSYRAWVAVLEQAVQFVACGRCGERADQALGMVESNGTEVPVCSQSCLDELTALLQEARRDSRVVYPSAHTFPSVQAWLDLLELSSLLPLFQEKGYDEIEHIKLAGLNQDDFEYLGIDDLSARSKLETPTAAALGYTPAPLRAVKTLPDVLVLQIKRAAAFGKVVRYEVEAQLGEQSASTLKRYSDFDHLHSRLQVRNKQQGLPALPRKGVRLLQNQLDPTFIETRREALEAYLTQAVETLGKDPELLRFVGLDGEGQ